MYKFSHRFFKPFKSRLPSFFSLVFLHLFVLFTLLLSADTAHSFNVSFAWDANTEPDLAGYRVFYREEGQDYDFDFPDWEGAETICTLYGLDDDTTYYFVSRAYDIYGNESENSIELFTSDAGATITTTGDGRWRMFHCNRSVWFTHRTSRQTAASISRSFSVEQYPWKNFCAPLLRLLSTHCRCHFSSRELENDREMESASSDQFQLDAAAPWPHSYTVAYRSDGFRYVGLLWENKAGR